MSLIVERVQYGVGQGAFHTQSITIDEHCIWRCDLHYPESGVRFDFVYDCGTKGSKVGKAIANSIKHYKPKGTIDGQTTTKIVDAVFISHFHDDHINGIDQLCKAKQVVRIFAPFHTQEDVLAVILRSSSANIKGAHATLFLTELRNLYRRERLFGRPTIYVTPPDMRNEFDPPESLTNPELPRFPEGVRVSDSVNSKACFTDDDAIEFGPANCDWQIWEIKTWHFRQHDPAPSAEWQDAIAELGTIFGTIFSNTAAIDAAAAEDLLKKAAMIRQKMCVALQIEEVEHAGNHNLVSMCVYSGPADCNRPWATSTIISRMNGPNSGNILAGTHLDFTLHSPKFGYLRGESHFADQVSNRTGWLGTGDALLGNPTVWQDFENRLEWQDRSENVATVQVPHHGSAGDYYNSDLFDNSEILAVISAGAYSSYGHPAVAVLSDILQRGNPVVHIHEFVRPGLIEIVKVDY